MDEQLTPKDIFSKMADYFDPGPAKGMNAEFEYDLSGKNGGVWHVVIKDQKCTVAEGKAKSPVTTFVMSDETFVRISMGQTNPMIAFSLGKLKILGDPMKAASLMKLFKRV